MRIFNDAYLYSMKNIYNICTGFLAKTVVMIVLLIAGGVNVVWGETYEKVTSKTQLVPGCKYLIGYIGSSNTYIMSNSTSTNNIGSINAGYNNDIINVTDNMLQLQLGGSEGKWTFETLNSQANGYLNATKSTSSTGLKISSTVDDYSYFMISILDKYNAEIKCNNKNKYNIIRFYTKGGYFSCYTSDQYDVYLFKEVVSGSTLSFNMNGAEIGQQIARVTSFPCALPSTASYSREGYIANGWNTKADGSGVHYDEGDSFVAPDEDVTLFVEWRKVDVDDDALCVKFNAGENGTYNGGDVAETVAGDGIVLPDVAAKDGWTFIGWATTENSAIADAGKAGMVFHPSMDGQVLYAVYEVASVNHTAKFFVNGEQISKTQELHAGDDVVFPNEIPADINGKKFVGWMKGEISRSQDDVPLLLENAKMENSDVEFHAVFAKENSDDGQKIILSDEFGPRSSNDSGSFDSENFTGTNYKAFASQFGGVKLGTADSYGYITSRNLDLSQPFTVSVKVKGWTTVEGTLGVTIDDDKQTKKSYTYSAVSSSEYETAVFEFDAATSSSTIRIATSSKRAYIDDVVVTTAGAVYSGYCTSLLTVKKAVSVVTSENRKIDLSEEDVTGDFVEAVSKDESVKGKNVIVFVGKDIALNEGIENVAVMQSDGSYLCRNLVLTDDGAFSTSIPFVANTATYTRALGADSNDYGTICLPYGVTSDSNIQYYKLLSCGTDVLTFAKVNQVDAYTPVLYHRLNNGNIEVSACDVLIAATGAMKQQGESGKMVGVMKPTSVVDGTSCTVPKDGYAMVVDSNCYYIKNGQFWSLNERVNLKAFRAYMSCNQASGASKAAVLNICLDEEMPTDVRIIERNDGLVDMVFDLGGRRVVQNTGGVHIVNGKKIVQR